LPESLILSYSLSFSDENFVDFKSSLGTFLPFYFLPPEASVF
jgi:hypothetical protein